MFNKGGSGILYTWDVARGAEVHHFAVPLPSQQGFRRTLTISPDGRNPGRRGTDEANPSDPPGRWLGAAANRRPRGTAHTLEFSPDGTRLLSGGEDQAARIWDVATGRPVGEPIKHRSWVEAIAVAPGGRVAASGGQDYLIRTWDPNTSRGAGPDPGSRVLGHGYRHIARRRDRDHVLLERRDPDLGCGNRPSTSRDR